MPEAKLTRPREVMPPEFVPILVRFRRPEGAILGADLVTYGPFRQGEVAAIPLVHAVVFLRNDAALLYEGGDA